MFIPEFLFEEEDIFYLKKNKIFLNEYIDKFNGGIYFKINNKKLNNLIDLLYENKILGDYDKSEIEFNLKIVMHIFTGIIQKRDFLDLTNSILSYHRINPGNSKKLMSLIKSNIEVSNGR